jgi:MoaA/NifB/PqqE/SkfB family radical SAM enzyme
MKLITDLKKHYNYIKYFKSYNYLDLIKQAFSFPIDYYLRNGKAFFPLNIAYFLTLKCNKNCSFCNLKDYIKNSNNVEPTLEQYQLFLKQIKNYKTSITLFGGEPLLKNDICDFIKKTKKYNINCGFFTNGILLNEKKFKELIDSKTDYIVISISYLNDYYLLKEKLNYICKNKKSTKIIIQTMIDNENLDNILELFQILSKKNIDLIRLGHPTFYTEYDINKIKSTNISFKNSFNNSEIEKIKKIVTSTKKNFKNVIFNPSLEKKEISGWYKNIFETKRKCLFVWRGTFILPNGDVIPCESFNTTLGNIYKKNFIDIWNSPKYRKFRLQIKNKLLPGCVRCCKL